MFRLPSKGSTFATVALAGKDVALAGLGYRGPDSRELVIENTGHYDPGGRSRQVTLTNTSGLKRLASLLQGAHSSSVKTATKAWAFQTLS